MSKSTEKRISLASLLDRLHAVAVVRSANDIRRGSIAEARVAILEGRVKVNGTIVLNPEHMIPLNAFDVVEVAYTKWDSRTTTVLHWKRRFVA